VLTGAIAQKEQSLFLIEVKGGLVEESSLALIQQTSHCGSLKNNIYLVI
jgi:hypothetical protein